MASEQFSLCWDNFHKNMSSGMQSLLENEDLVDVTLAVEGRHLKAHKMVLSVCSPYFRELFQSNPCQHPIVFMKDVSYIALSDLLQFMYQGEVQVAQENLTTFIKTAEALQIKGLTADGPHDSEEPESTEVEKPVVESSVKRNYDSTPKPSPAARVKRPAGPASKRQKYSLPPTDHTLTPITPSASAITVVSKTETPVAPSPESMVLFKMEPESANQIHSDLIDESQGEAYGEDSAIDDTQDDTDDYALMETADDEPKAGTSTDGAGECQDGDVISMRKKYGTPSKPRPRFVMGGFVYHSNLVAGCPPNRYLGCAAQKRTGCRGRATLPLDGTLAQLKLTKEHNHPPDMHAEEKYLFVVQLRQAVRSMVNSTLKNVYEVVALDYPQAAQEISFRSISSSLHRWRRGKH